MLIMKVYSKTIETFIPRLRKWAREILRQEFGLNIARTRFHMDNGWSYPIVIVAIDDKKRLGYFDSEQLTIGINRSLIYLAKERVIKDILRHELAHYLTFVFYAKNYSQLEPHGAEFRAICQHFHLDSKIISASIDLRLENESLEGDLPSERIINKVAKLLALASSSNQSEAELATVKANQLMLQHNLDRLTVSAHGDGAGEEELFFVKQVLGGKRDTPRRTAIAQILFHFFVYPVRCRDGLEVTGTKANVENANYLANYLDGELKRIYRAAKKNSSCLREKPFMVALANTFCARLEQSQQEGAAVTRRALMVIEQQLNIAVKGIYGRTTGVSSSFVNCQHSHTLGQEAGQKLQLRRGVTSSDPIRLLKR